MRMIAADDESEEWYRLSRQILGAAYDDDEPEYSEEMIKIPNPDFRHEGNV